MKHSHSILRALLVALLLFAQQGALAHAIRHAAENDKGIVSAELCVQCLDFAQIDAGPLTLDLPRLPVPHGKTALQVPIPVLSPVFDSPSFDFQARAPPFLFN